MAHNESKNFPFENLFGIMPSHLGHIDSFGCQMVCQTATKKIITTSTRTKGRVRLYQEAEKVKNFLSAENLFKAIHKRAIENSSRSEHSSGPQRFER